MLSLRIRHYVHAVRPVATKKLFAAAHLVRRDIRPRCVEIMGYGSDQNLCA